MKTTLLHFSPKLILALLITVGICVIALGIIFIRYKRKTTLSSSTVENLIKLVPSLVGNTPSLGSLLPILSEHTSSRTKTRTTPTTVSTLHQTTPDELILPPVLYQYLRLPLHLHLLQLCLNQYTLSKDQSTKAIEQNILLKRKLLNLFCWKCLTRLLLT